MHTVLVIEDNPDNMRLITYVLERARYSVVTAETGEKGVELAKSGTYAFVIMDIMLPGIDGVEATRQIRALSTKESLPIIAMTSYAMRGDREKVFAAGCNGYIEKPIDPITVMDRLHCILGGTER